MELAQIKIRLDARKAAALVVPILLILSTYWLFGTFHQQFGYPLGYLLGFGVYWVGWCLLVPLALLGGSRELLNLFRPMPRFSELGWKTHLLLWTPVIFPLFFRFLPKMTSAGAAILFVSVLIGVVIGVTEEVLWRGMYMRLFPGNIWLNLVYPSIMFGVWHISPQAVLANQSAGGVLSFTIYAVILGFVYGLTVYRTKSIAWCTISHIIHDALGLGAFAYAAWLVR